MRHVFAFTLIELMVTLAVLAILLTFGVPQFQSITANNRLTTSINQFSAELGYARAEAVKRSVPVVITANDNTDWAAGWTISAGGNNLRITPALSGGVNFVEASDADSITFNPDGRLAGVVGDLVFTLCDERGIDYRNGDYGKRITLRPTGQSTLDINVSCL